jgi:carbon storage regulator
MLVLSRKKNETIEIDGGIISIRVVEIRGDKVRLGIEAAPEILVHRGEVQEAINRGKGSQVPA